MLKTYLAAQWQDIRRQFTLKRALFIIFGVAVYTFGIYNVHRQSGITEGGAIGLILLLNNIFGLDASIASPIIDAICYMLAFTALGSGFLLSSAFTSICIALFFKLWESFPPFLPSFAAMPLTAALLGAVFIGVSVGIVVRNGGSCSGDDALALLIQHKTGWRLSRAYLISDLTVLLLSLSYIPFQRIAYSILTVTLSSLIIDGLQRGHKQK